MHKVWKICLPAMCLPLLGADDLFLFRGDFIYVLPTDISGEMLQLADRDSWRHFPEHTRYIDEDRDGSDDYVAIAIGAAGGFGMQLRYRLRRLSEGERRLGRWYWCVITDSRGESVFEKFNP